MAERRRGVRFVGEIIAVFAAIFVTIWGVFVLPLFFQAPHTGELPALYGADFDYSPGNYGLVEGIGTALYLSLPIVFIGIWVYTYYRMLRDLPRLAAQTEANRAARRELEAREAAELPS